MYMETRFPRTASEAAARALRVGATEDTAKVSPTTRTRGDNKVAAR
jgi:hypothetical protein